MHDGDLFTRLSTVHRPDCAIFKDGPLPLPAPDPDTLAQTLGTDEAALYATQCRPAFEDLRRIVGQLAGLTILAELSRRAEVADLTELDACRQRWIDCKERLGTLRAPSALAGHRDQVVAAHDFAGRALSAFNDLRPNTDNERIFDAIARHVRRAYTHLSAATSQKAGFEMADLTNACCSCGR